MFIMSCFMFFVVLTLVVFVQAILLKISGFTL